MPGWIDSLFGPTAVVAANGKGIFHTMICDESIVVDFIPADTVSHIISSRLRAKLMYLCCFGVFEFQT